MFGHLRTRLFAAALLLPLVAFATATGGSWLRCRLTGAVLDNCCCSGDEAAAKTPATATVSEADCCDRVIRSVAPAVAELQATTAAPDVFPDLSVGMLALEGPATDDVVAQGRVHAVARGSLAPPTARLRLLTKSTLLI